MWLPAPPSTSVPGTGAHPAPSRQRCAGGQLGGRHGEPSMSGGRSIRPCLLRGQPTMAVPRPGAGSSYEVGSMPRWIAPRVRCRDFRRACTVVWGAGSVTVSGAGGTDRRGRTQPRAEREQPRSTLIRRGGDDQHGPVSVSSARGVRMCWLRRGIRLDAGTSADILVGIAMRSAGWQAQCQGWWRSEGASMSAQAAPSRAMAITGNIV